MTRPAATVAEQIAEIDRLITGRHIDDTACGEPSPTSKTPRDVDGLLAENAWERGQEALCA